MSLIVQNVRRSFGTVEAVSGVSFEVEPGTVFGLLGPNGAGKTTTMRMILGIYIPDTGHVEWNGRNVGGEERQRFGYLPEERGLYPKMKVADQISYFGRLQGMTAIDAEASANRWLARLDISNLAKRSCGELSKGNQQKVQLATSLVHSPALVVLDEPFSGLDPVNAETMLACIREVAEAGTTVVVSSHQMFQIESACKEFVILGNGHIRARGTLAQLRDEFPTRRVHVAPDGAAVRAVFERHESATNIPGNGTSLVYEMPKETDFRALMREVVNASGVDTFEKREPTLAQIYVRALGMT